MEYSEQTPCSANAEVSYSAAAHTDMHWYYYWPSHLGSSAPYHPQMDSHVSGHWAYYIDHPLPGSHSNLPPTPYSLEVWDPPGQGRVDCQYVGGGEASPSSQVPLGLPLQIPNDRSSYRDEPSSSSWAPNVAVSAHSTTPSRRPSHCSDPGLPTNFQDNSGSRCDSDPRLNTESDVVTSELDPTGVDHQNSPSDTEPSPSAGPSPGNRHVVRPVIRCWDHGCDGRRFSSISNFRRHQRERAGQTPVCFCPRCGAAFYRRWTRDHHVERGSCLRIPRWS